MIQISYKIDISLSKEENIFNFYPILSIFSVIMKYKYISYINVHLYITDRLIKNTEDFYSY